GRLIEVGRELKNEDGADAVVLGCAGMARHRKPLEDALGIVVIDPTRLRSPWRSAPCSSGAGHRIDNAGGMLRTLSPCGAKDRMRGIAADEFRPLTRLVARALATSHPLPQGERVSERSSRLQRNSHDSDGGMTPVWEVMRP